MSGRQAKSSSTAPALFVIDRTTGALAFRTAPDFEAPADSDADNVYVVRIGATDRSRNGAGQTVTVTVLDVVNDRDLTPPVITGPSGGPGATASSKAAFDGAIAVHTFPASETAAWSISGGADAARFAIDASGGALTFLTIQDFETPTDAGADNVYDVVITATDPTGNARVQIVNVTVVAVDETALLITGSSGGLGAAASVVTVDEYVSTFVHAFTADKPVTWSISGGADSGLFVFNTPNGELTFRTQKDFETPTRRHLPQFHLPARRTARRHQGRRLDGPIRLERDGLPALPDQDRLHPGPAPDGEPLASRGRAPRGHGVRGAPDLPGLLAPPRLRGAGEQVLPAATARDLKRMAKALMRPAPIGR